MLVPPRSLRVQRPPLWMFDALGILTGVSPQSLAGELVGTVDVMQGGIGVAQYSFESAVSAAGGVGNLQINTTKDEVKLVQASLTLSLSTATSLLASRFSLNPGGGAITIFSEQVAATTPISWARLNGNDPNAWWVIHPFQGLSLTVGAQAGQVNSIFAQIITVPAGTKPW